MVLSFELAVVSAPEPIPFPIAITLSSSPVDIDWKLALPIWILLCPFTHPPDPLPRAMLLFPTVLFCSAFKPWALLCCPVVLFANALVPNAIL